MSGHMKAINFLALLMGIALVTAVFGIKHTYTHQKWISYLNSNVNKLVDYTEQQAKSIAALEERVKELENKLKDKNDNTGN